MKYYSERTNRMRTIKKGTRLSLVPQCDLCSGLACAVVRIPGGCTCFTDEYQRRCEMHIYRLSDSEDEFEIVQRYQDDEPCSSS